jgi:uncharacterized protein (DUF433 family)
VNSPELTEEVAVGISEPTSLLDRRVTTVREAARQLGIPEKTVVNWVDGWTNRGVWYPPVLREEPTGDKVMTWGEVVEARYLRAYRKRNVTLRELRDVIARLRERLNIPYPLAHYEPFIGANRRLLLEIQEKLHLPPELSMVYEITTGQLILDKRVDAYLESIEFAEGGEQEARRIYPAGRKSQIVIDPAVSSAAATIRGIRTEVLAELADADVPVEQIAEDFNLESAMVKAALSYEWSKATAA